MEQNLSPNSFRNKTCHLIPSVTCVHPLSSHHFWYSRGLHWVTVRYPKWPVWICPSGTLVSPGMKPLSGGEMSSCISRLFSLDSTQNDPVCCHVCQLHKESCEDSSIACLKCLTNSSLLRYCSLIMTASIIKAPICTQSQGFPFLCIEGQAEIVSSLISLSFSLLSDSFHGFHVLGS